MSSIVIENLIKYFHSIAKEKNEIFNGLNLKIPLGQIVSILGPSGCGKTTLLNLISGLDRSDGGDIRLPNKLNFPIGYMLQDDLLLPWRTLEENASLGLEVMQRKKISKSKELESYLRAFGIYREKDKYPDVSSGGMKQRTALVRTLLTLPKILLLDEPFSNLDFDIKLKVQEEILNYRDINQATIIVVTHDIEDAIAISDKIIILSEKPARVKKVINLKHELSEKDPISARKSLQSRNYFIQVWDELKYVKNHAR